ncbi:hypothetical protein FJT64_007491 [Amphibalanus amphitrite]|uniref:Uncharacterized protein n=1 Tax=Amphibalanus amphitrite TaxID=1232801 RepID=A0A6A4VPS1_AMPAM|nr:hypothetical protein FJT64_007491 [Amphibalanus amphitrite]
MVPPRGLPLTCAVLLAAAGEPERRILVTVVPDPQHDYVRHPGARLAVVAGADRHRAAAAALRSWLRASRPTSRFPQLLSTQRPPRPDSELRQQTPALEPAGDPRQQTPALQPDSELRSSRHRHYSRTLNSASRHRHYSRTLIRSSRPQALQPAEESGQPEWTRDLPAEWTDRYPVASAYMDSYQSYTSEPSRRPGSLLSRLVGPLLTWQDRPSGQRLLRYLANPLSSEHWTQPAPAPQQ